MLGSRVQFCPTTNRCWTVWDRTSWLVQNIMNEADLLNCRHHQVPNVTLLVFPLAFCRRTMAALIGVDLDSSCTILSDVHPISYETSLGLGEEEDCFAAPEQCRGRTCIGCPSDWQHMREHWRGAKMVAPDKGNKDTHSNSTVSTVYLSTSAKLGTNSSALDGITTWHVSESELFILSTCAFWWHGWLAARKDEET